MEFNDIRMHYIYKLHNDVSYLTRQKIKIDVWVFLFTVKNAFDIVFK